MINVHKSYWKRWPMLIIKQHAEYINATLWATQTNTSSYALYMHGVITDVENKTIVQSQIRFYNSIATI
jgi:hypothetical protein